MFKNTKKINFVNVLNRKWITYVFIFNRTIAVLLSAQ